MGKRLVFSLTAILAIVIARPFVSSDTSAQDSLGKDQAASPAVTVSNESTSKTEAEPKTEKLSDLAAKRSARFSNVLRKWRDIKGKGDIGAATEADERQVKEEYFAEREINSLCSTLEKLIERHPNSSISKRAEKALRELSDGSE